MDNTSINNFLTSCSNDVSKNKQIEKQAIEDTIYPKNEILARDLVLYLKECIYSSGKTLGNLSKFEAMQTDEILNVINRDKDAVPKPSEDVTEFLRRYQLIDSNGKFTARSKDLLIKNIHACLYAGSMYL